MFHIPLHWLTEITQVKEPEYFVDEQRLGPYALWHHEHHLKPVTGGVLMTDIVSYSPPLGFLGRIANQLFIRKKLEEIFIYRKAALDDYFSSNEQV
jgi:ligand-binding SRPBCC domain-containing protein